MLPRWRTLRPLLSYILTHPANEGHQLLALSRALRFQLMGRLFGRPGTAKLGTLVIKVPLGAHGASKAVYATPPDWAEMQAWKRLLRPGDLFVDVGSNVGLYAVWAASCGATPLCAEPDPVNARLTRGNLECNGVAGEVHQVALAAAPGTARFTVAADATNRLATTETGDQTREVEVRTLDDLLGYRHARGMKVDTEGAERLVLEGGARALAEHRIDVIQLEWNALSLSLLGETRAPVRELLGRHGYRLCRPDPVTYQLSPLEVADTDTEDVFAVAPTARL